ncbi:MAG: hypothetical protein HYY36_05060 [Gammaproteobacteria bacterium]|nr:hypothetical protein [Gammaproteobacteria bacterium]
MAPRKSNVPAPIGIHELELTLIREKQAWQDWELRDAAEELELMGRIAKQTGWPRDYKPLIEAFHTALSHTRDMVRNRDTTRIAAAHSKLEQAIFALRDRLYT